MFAEKILLATDNISVSDIVDYYHRIDIYSDDLKSPFLSENTIIVRYYIDESSSASPFYTVFEYGNKTKLCTTVDLGFVKEGFAFEGWSVFRRKDNGWYTKSSDGKVSWQQKRDSELPVGCEKVLYKDGIVLSKPVTKGEIHLIAEWVHI